MNRFVRASKYRHVYGQPVKREKCYDGIRLTKNVWDSNMIKANSKYLSVNWDASGGGAFSVIPLKEEGKLPELLPLFRGHTGPVLDTDWNPFDDEMVVSGSDDCTIGIYKVPEGFSTRVEDPENIKDVLPQKRLKGHSKKVGHVLFHPVAENILASASADYTVKIWNIETEQCLTTLVHTDLITSLAFNENGSKLATVTRNKQLQVWDIRENKIISEGKAHNGAKSQRLCWLGSYDRLATTGFDRSDRQFALWDANNIDQGPIGGFQMNGSSSGICMPFFDEGTNILYLVGKGDGNIVYYEYTPEDDKMYQLSQYQSTEPQRGVAVLPRRALSIHNHEIFRFFKSINDTTLEPVSFYVPRKAETFQDDVYSDAKAGEPALTADEWWGGKDSNPKVISLAAVFDGQQAKAFTSTSASVSKQPSRESIKAPAAAPAPAKKEVAEEPASKKSSTVNTPDISTPSEKKDLDQILSGPGVDKLLNKANNTQDEPPKSLESNSWESEDDEPVIERENIRSRTAEIKAVDQIKKEPGSESEQDEIATPLNTASTPNRGASPPPAPSSVGNSTRETVDLTQEEVTPPASNDDAVAKLTDQVTKLTSSLDSLVAQLKRRDDKIDQLEEKIDSLLKN